MANCDNCGRPGPFIHVFLREAGSLTVIKTVHFDGKDCLDALEKKWLSHDRERSDYLLNNWGTLPRNEEIQR